MQGCGIGEMWGNNWWGNFPKNLDWYNPGFLKNVDNIPDVTTVEIFFCLTSSTDIFDKLISQLKTKTVNDGQVDNAFANYTDWS